MVVVLGLAFLALFVVVLSIVPRWQGRGATDPGAIERLELENELRRTLAQIFGGALLVLGAAQAWRSYQLALSSDATDRFFKASSQISSESVPLRVGAIYALERIAIDSPRDHWPVVQVVMSFVRSRAGETMDAKAATDDPGLFHHLPADLQAGLTVLARRRADRDLRRARLNLDRLALAGARLQLGDWRLASFRGADLRRAAFLEAELTKADFGDPRLNYSRNEALADPGLKAANLRWLDLRKASARKAVFSGADLSWADLRGADLSSARFSASTLFCVDAEGADFSDARLGRASLERADLRTAKFDGAIFEKARLDAADLRGVDLTRAQGLSQEQIDAACVDGATRLPEGLRAPVPCPAAANRPGEACGTPVVRPD
jgi:uncharacterized protein YjbI with pentapeptide repeats